MDSTVSGNRRDHPECIIYQAFGGGGISVSGGITVTNSIVAGNTNSAAPDILDNTVASISNSAIGDPTGCAFSGSHNLPFGTDLKLGPLANNGGPTLSMVPQAGSPLIDAAPMG